MDWFWFLLRLSGYELVRPPGNGYGLVALAWGWLWFDFGFWDLKPNRPITKPCPPLKLYLNLGYIGF